MQAFVHHSPGSPISRALLLMLLVYLLMQHSKQACIVQMLMAPVALHFPFDAWNMLLPVRYCICPPPSPPRARARGEGGGGVSWDSGPLRCVASTQPLMQGYLLAVCVRARQPIVSNVHVSQCCSLGAGCHLPIR